MYDTLAAFCNATTETKIKLQRKGKPSAFTWKVDIILKGKLFKSNTFQIPAGARNRFMEHVHTEIAGSNLTG